MAHKSAPSSTGTSVTITTSALGHSTMAMRTRTKSHGKVSRAELRVGRELGGEVLAVAVLQIPRLQWFPAPKEARIAWSRRQSRHASHRHQSHHSLPRRWPGGSWPLLG